MLLAIDIGNTNIVLGVFSGDRLVGHWRLSTDAEKMPDEYAVLVRTLLEHEGRRTSEVDGVCIASVVPPLTATFRELAERYFKLVPIVVNADLESGVKIATDFPREVGADRIANAAAALKVHSVPAIVVDFGTATTFDAISSEGELLGTAIAPGFLAAMEGLYRHAAQLHHVELRAPRTAIGRNTAEALRSGAIYGYVGLVEGLVHRMRLEMGGNPLVIATGGVAPMVISETSVFDVHDPELTLHGLRLIHGLNVASGAPRRARARVEKG
ncbi:MAG: type III pantothenate kinase [Chloroflexi bacterium]|nr:type III pantothenate kinase [Chloroflexota bacterium]